MNIFVTDICPVKSAKLLDRKRQIKMILESTQLICTTLLYYKGTAPYKSTHVNHPCSIWVRQSRSNTVWLLNHLKALCNEYTNHYKRIHKCEQYIPSLESQLDIIPDTGLTPFVNVTNYKEIDNVFEAYRKCLQDKWDNDNKKELVDKQNKIWYNKKEIKLNF